MRTLKYSWFMIQGEFRGYKMKIVGILAFTIFLMGYLAAFTGTLFNDAISDHEQTLISDFTLLWMIPVLGFTYSRRSLMCWSDDSYTKMLAYLHSLPIPANVILCKREMQALLSFAANGILYFGLLYGISSGLRAELSPLSFIAFALTWTGFGIAFTGIYIAIEFLCSGKTYFLLIGIIVGVCIVTSIVIKLAGGNLLFYTVSASKEWGLGSPLMWGSLLAGMVLLQLFSKWTIRRLEKRDLV